MAGAGPSFEQRRTGRRGSNIDESGRRQLSAGGAEGCDRSVGSDEATHITALAVSRPRGTVERQPVPRDHGHSLRMLDHDLGSWLTMAIVSPRYFAASFPARAFQAPMGPPQPKTFWRPPMLPIETPGPISTSMDTEASAPTEQFRARTAATSSSEVAQAAKVLRSSADIVALSPSSFLMVPSASIDIHWDVVTPPPWPSDDEKLVSVKAAKRAVRPAALASATLCRGPRSRKRRRTPFQGAIRVS